MKRNTIVSLTVVAAMGVMDTATAAVLSTQEYNDEQQIMCHDDQSFESKMGVKCAQHASFDCNGFADMGFNEQEMEALLRRCPISCQVDPCVPDDQVVSEREEEKQFASKISAISPPLLRAVSTKNIPPPMTKQNVRRRAGHELQNICFEDWDASCQDNPQYKSPLGTDCSTFQIFDCKHTVAIGFNDTDIANLILNCPCSCGIECGTWEEPVRTISTDPGDNSNGSKNHADSTIAASTEAEESNAGDSGEGTFSIQNVMEQYGVFIYAGIGAVVFFVAVIYIVRSYQKRNEMNAQMRGQSDYDYEDGGSRTSVYTQSRVTWNGYY